MKYKMYTHKEFCRILKNNGYVLIRQKGSHSIWNNNNGNHITITKEINPMVARRLIRENCLTE